MQAEKKNNKPRMHSSYVEFFVIIILICGCCLRKYDRPVVWEKFKIM